MATTIINSFKVENFQNWKQAFDLGKAMREKIGIRILGVYQSVDDESSISVHCEMSSADAAKKLMSSPEMKEVWKKSGVIATPEIKILSQII
jgi:hypothetical protein